MRGDLYRTRFTNKRTAIAVPLRWFNCKQRKHAKFLSCALRAYASFAFSCGKNSSRLSFACGSAAQGTSRCDSVLQRLIQNSPAPIDPILRYSHCEARRISEAGESFGHFRKKVYTAGCVPGSIPTDGSYWAPFPGSGVRRGRSDDDVAFVNYIRQRAISKYWGALAAPFSPKTRSNERRKFISKSEKYPVRTGSKRFNDWNYLNGISINGVGVVAL
jgi:hypothetical protein